MDPELLRSILNPKEIDSVYNALNQLSQDDPETFDEIARDLDSLSGGQDPQILRSFFLELAGLPISGVDTPDIAPGEVPPLQTPTSDVEKSQARRLSIQGAAADRERGVSSFVNPLYETALAAAPTTEEKIEILRDAGLTPQFLTTGELVFQDPNNEEIKIPINAAGADIGDLARLVPGLLSGIIEVGMDLALETEVGKQALAVPQSASAIGKFLQPARNFIASVPNVAARGGRAILGRAGVAGLAGGTAAAINNAMAVAGGAQKNRTAQDRLRIVLERTLGQGAVNALGFALPEVAVRGGRAVTQGIFNNPATGLPSDKFKKELADTFQKAGLPGEATLRGRTFIAETLQGVSSKTKEAQRASLKVTNAVNDMATDLYKPLSKRMRVKDPNFDDIHKILPPIEDPPVTSFFPRALGSEQLEILNRFDTGELTKANLDEFIKESTEKLGKPFEEIGELVGDAVGTGTNTAIATANFKDAFPVPFAGEGPLITKMRKIDALLKNEEVPLFGPGGPIITPGKRGANNFFPDSKLPSQKLPQEELKILKYKEIDAMRKDIGNLINWNNAYIPTSADHYAVQVYGGLSDDSLDILAKARPDLEETALKAKADWKTFRDFVRHPEIAKIHKKDPYDLANGGASGIFSSPDDIKRIVKITKNPQDRANIGASYVQAVFGADKDTPLSGLNIDAIAKKIKENKEIWDKVFSDEGFFPRESSEKIIGLLSEAKKFQVKVKSRDDILGKLLETEDSVWNGSYTVKDIESIQKTVRAKLRADRNSFTKEQSDNLSEMLMFAKQSVDFQTKQIEGRKAVKDAIFMGQNDNITSSNVASPFKIISNIKKLHDSKLLEQDIPIVFKDRISIDLLGDVLDPKEMEQLKQLVEVSEGASILNILGGDEDLAAQAFEKGILGEGKIMPNAFATQTIYARIFRGLFSIPARMMLHPKNMNRAIVNRALKGTLRDPKNRLMELGTMEGAATIGAGMNQFIEEPQTIDAP